MAESTFAPEALSDAELELITGAKSKARQIVWLEAKGWAYVVSGSGRPRVGRIYARARLCGMGHDSALAGVLGHALPPPSQPAPSGFNPSAIR